jgi:membrane protein implicated in regulation of membrane protease activity
MDPWLIGLIFVIIGVVLLVWEAATPGTFFVAIPGTILIALGIIGMIIPGFLTTIYAPIVAIIITIPVTIGVFLFYKSIAPPGKPMATSGSSLIGKEGVVMKKIIPDSLDGKVEIEHQMWSATGNTEIEKGKRVKVTRSKGVHVFVEGVK